MSETYVECLVKCKSSALANFFKWLCAVIAGLCVVLAMLTGMGLLFIVAIVFGGLAYFINGRSEIEYEYLYLDKEITIDKIFNATKRKKAAKYEVERIEIIAPFNSHELDSYRNRNVKEKDFSTGIVETPDTRFVMYYNGEERIVFSPSDELLKAIKTVAPRKVFLY